MSAALFQPFPILNGARAQVWRHHPEFRRPRHFHEEPELNLIARGAAHVGVGDRVIEVSAGDMLFFAPGQDHVLLEASDDFDLFVMALTPELAARACGSPAVATSRSWRVAAAELSSTVALLEGLRELRDGSVAELSLTELFRKAGTRAGGHVLSRRAVECVRAQLSVSGTELARMLRTAPSGISRRFHEDLGVTFVEYRSRLRLMRFVNLVDEGKTFTRAAQEAEFGSYAQCHRVFHRVFACAPQDYFAGTRALLDNAKFLQG